MTLLNDFGVVDQFGESLEAIKKTSKLLRPFSYPNASEWDERIVEPLKEAVVELDDYALDVVYTSCRYDAFILDYIKVSGINIPFLPSRLVCDVGRRTFDGDYIGHFAMLVSGKQHHWWLQAKDFDENPVPLPFSGKDPVKEMYGIRYTEVSRENMSLY